MRQTTMPPGRATSPSAALQRLHRVLMPVGRLRTSERPDAVFIRLARFGHYQPRGKKSHPDGKVVVAASKNGAIGLTVRLADVSE
jgi:hypothetical protein